ncbi:MFS transporter [Pigmentiphaga litoralis]|jgi:tripartite-type tricarboxylate transporter receptor subunit TctC|uniref:Bug family tripartite tricarboxylate transporter substrate binding protein n=1 Tax=Pigmentiphaga litoralis TaxID=516702 RepID=UPI0019A60DA3|nr:tripartite tricarboxylate transporter substrate binding protein [Pigmentiphaga litoralis]GGX16188.1 MFS transporter [Pigmentiphaga litoralis]
MRCWTPLMTGLLLACAALGARAESDYPNRPIRMVVPLAVASSVDNAARILAQKMSSNMGQAIIIENLPGAAGVIGAERVAKSPPDGYTLGAFHDGLMTMVPHLQASLNWDIMKDFEPISLVATIEWGLVTAPNAPFDTAADFIKVAKANPKRIYYGTGGIGSPQHVAMALFAADAGIHIEHVTYKGATQAALGVAGGDVQIGFQGIATVAPMVRSGKLKLLGVATPGRMAQYPDTPTISESGLRGFEFSSWFAMMVPAGTPADIRSRLHSEIMKALQDPDVRGKLEALGLKPGGSTPEYLARATRAQYAAYGKMMHDAGIKPEH